MRAITVCVDYSDLLAITLPANRQHFDEMLVVTGPRDDATVAECMKYPDVSFVRTDAFYRDGAAFNKGLAIEEAFDKIGRNGWFCVLDADILLPLGAIWADVEMFCLTAPRRRMVYDRDKWFRPGDWQQYPLFHDVEHAGYCQIFSGDDPALRRRPWYGVDWRHAGGCDSDFAANWPPHRLRRPPWHVLHLGQPGINWCGRVQPWQDGRVPVKAHERRVELNRLMRARSCGSYKNEKLQPKGEQSC